MLLSLKTGKKCLKVRIKLKGRAKQYAQKGVEGLYNRLPKLENGHAIYKKEKRPTTVYIWWDPKKKSSRGDDRSHWKIGTLMNNVGIGYLDTYDSRPFGKYALPYDKSNTWSFFTNYFPHCTRCWGPHWEVALPEDVRVECA